MFASIWYSERIRSWSAQAILLGAFIALIYWLVDNAVTNLAARGISVGFDFLWRSARFPISESVLDYEPTNTFFWALVVGLANTLWASVIIIVLSTLLGLVVGLARRSKNPMTSGVAGVYITAIRNTPMIVQLLFWYALATTALPAPGNALNPVAGVFISLRGVYLPSLQISGSTDLAWYGAAVGVALLVGIFLYRRRGRTIRRSVVLGLAAAYAICLVAVWIAGGLSASISVPELRGFNFAGGMRLSSEFSALIIGSVIYTSAFIGEIIRGGIDAVGRGQWEAGRAIGLTERRTLSKVIIPQALRIIIPPMTTQYLSAVKNTTLAIAVGFPELGLVVGTVINQTGQALESIFIMLAVFLSISLSVSLFMNWYNRKVALVQR